MALWRDPRLGEAGHSRLRNLLVCLAFLADVPGHAMDASQGHQLPDYLGSRYYFDGFPLCADDPNFGQVRNESLRDFLRLRKPFIRGIKGGDGDID